MAIRDQADPVAFGGMRRSSRRKVDVALLAAGALGVGVGASLGAAFGRWEEVTAIWAVAEVGEDGSAQVTELVDYDFGLTSDRHGIFRVVPGLATDAPISVASPDAPDDVLVTSEAAGTRIRVGAPDQTVSGEHRYEISYPLPGVAVGDEVAWDAVGTAWEVGIEAAEVHVVTPFELVEPACVTGTVGSTTPCDDVEQVEPGHLVARMDSLDAGDGMTLTARRGSALPQAPATPALPGPLDDPGTGPIVPGGVAGGAAFAGSVVALRAVRRAGRERVVVGVGGPADAAFAPTPPGPGGVGPQEMRVDQDELESMATTDFAPPEGLTPSQGGIVLTEHVRPEHKVAWLIDAAIEGAVELSGDGDGGADGMTLVRSGPGSPETAPILDQAFAGRPWVSLGSYDPSFATGWSQLGTQLDVWRQGSGLWDQRAGSRRVAALVLGVLSAGAGLLAAVGGGVLANRFGSPWLLLAGLGGLLAGAGIAAAVASWELYVRTAPGSAAWLRVESFRRFLAASEGYHAEEAVKRGVLREYTAWAVAVGEIDRWASAVRASTIAPAVAGVGYVYMAPLLMSSTTSTSTAPSSRGGGGGFSGGGGGVGGGAGGGGGGSW